MRRAVMITRHEESAGQLHNGADEAGGSFDLPPLLPCMFNFSANHLLLISRTEYSSYAVLLMRDRDTQRVYRLYDFSKAQLIRPDVAYRVAGKINSADQLYLVIESVRLDTKHRRVSNPPVPADGAGGPGMR